MTPGYRNGYGKPRRLGLSCGTIKLSRPRVRNVKERFESGLLGSGAPLSPASIDGCG